MSEEIIKNRGWNLKIIIPVLGFGRAGGERVLSKLATEFLLFQIIKLNHIMLPQQKLSQVNLVKTVWKYGESLKITIICGVNA